MEPRSPNRPNLSKHQRAIQKWLDWRNALYEARKEHLHKTRKGNEVEPMRAMFGMWWIKEGFPSLINLDEEQCWTILDHISQMEWDTRPFLAEWDTRILDSETATPDP